VTLSFKIEARATLAIDRHNIKIICFANVQLGRSRVDADATAGRKQHMSAQGRRMVLIYRTNMHASSSMSPEMCTRQSNKNARQRWLIHTLEHFEQH